MVPSHVHGTPATAARACPQLCHGPQEWLAGFGVDLRGVGNIGIEEGKLVGSEIVLKGECQIPADAPVDLEPRLKLYIVLEIRRQVRVAQVCVTGTTPSARSDIPEQEARKANSRSCAGSTAKFSRVCSYVGGKVQKSCGAWLAPGSARFEVILMRLPEVHTDIHGVPSLLVEQIPQDCVSRFVVDGRRQAVSRSPALRLPCATTAYSRKANTGKSVRLPGQARG